MSARFVCDRCGNAFDDEGGRCPKCLRKSTVREAGERSSSSEAARLARGDHSQTSTARKATALWIALGLSAAIGIAVAFAWRWLASLEVTVPALIGAGVGAAAFMRAALAEQASLGAFARQCLVGAGLAIWASLSAVIAMVTSSDLSLVFTVIVGGVVFLGGVIPVLLWTRRDTALEAERRGKWR